MIDIPVVFICFNRLELIKITFSEIAKQKPKKLYIIMDGPRSSVSTDKRKILNIQKFIKKSINWNCNVFEIYSKKNLGLKNRIITGLNEVFKKNKNAIVLEEDCLPHDDFFFFCQNTLEEYKKNDKVKFITGNNFQKKQQNYIDDYYFSKYSHIWGWACNNKLWKEINFNHSYWEKYLSSNEFRCLFEFDEEYRYWIKTFDLIGKGKQTSWSIYLLLTMWKKKYLTVTPNINLVQNLGLNSGTNTKSLNLETKLSQLKLNKPLIHPKILDRNVKKDKYVYKHVYQYSLLKKMINKIISFSK